MAASVYLEEVERLVYELHPHLRGRLQVTMASSLDRDLGLDSLSRAELVARLESKFSVALPEAVVVGAETAGEIYQAFGTGASEPAPQRVALATEPGSAAPDVSQLDTLVDVLSWHAAQHPDRVHIHFIDEHDRAKPLSYGDLERGAHAVAAGLKARNVDPGQAVALMLPSGHDYFFAFLGVLLAGAVPVPIYPPARPSQLEDHVRRHARILDNAQTTVLIGFEQAKPVAGLLTSLVDSLRLVITVAELALAGERIVPPQLSADSIAFLQYTSGSTGDPKGVVLTHRNLLASLVSMHEALGVTESDIFVSWLPLYHDMGLIGAWLGSLTFAMPLVLMSPLSFLTRPARWLRAIETYGGTLSGGPNFAYELCLRRIDDADIEGLDLSSWRLAFNGAEPVSPQTLERFGARFSHYGFEPRALTPVYGLAEATLGVAFTPLGRGPRIEQVDRGVMLREGRAAVCSEAGDDALSYVSSGVPIPGFEVRIVDEAGVESPEREEGRLQFKGPATTSGYFRNAAATAGLFDGAWLESGDRGYIADGEVYVTGRTKDVIIRGGRNLYPYELELAIADIEGVRRGCVAVFGATDERQRTESLVVVAETREHDQEMREQMRRRIEALSTDLLGAAPDDVMLAPPYTVLKTSSGKIRRAVLRDLYQRGKLRRGTRAVWLQYLTLQGQSLVPKLRRFARLGARAVYAAYVWVLVLGAIAVAGCAVLLLPDARERRAVLRAVVRALLHLCGVSVSVAGLEHLPRDGPFVLVANHSSYVDSLVLVASLPRAIDFVAKRELAELALVRRFLARIGTRFVERFDRQQGVADAAKLTEALAQGAPLGFFPEGTFHRMPGLLPFQLGAFMAGAEARVPIVPVAIRGTRSILRGKSWMPRRGGVRVVVCEPVDDHCARCAAAQSDQVWPLAIALRDRTRAAILAQCGEPDMAGRRVLDQMTEDRRQKTEEGASEDKGQKRNTGD